MYKSENQATFIDEVSGEPKTINLSK